eukprot:CAMPEP_0119399050 /NCGR_PEP_ID=MMETSP1334-20130426/141162_1 /TAXON_ID=127549 /ORGANISM="Calcidiscus leptoporus, Strain RCC1130" /LENGTH=101 /DNA_ID=CAMNT_0007422933 /DNA_START=625 /DNA_END=931 /DNA_ORIENTATION=+
MTDARAACHGSNVQSMHVCVAVHSWVAHDVDDRRPSSVSWARGRAYAKGPLPDPPLEIRTDKLGMHMSSDESGLLTRSNRPQRPPSQVQCQQAVAVMRVRQ